jgi:hypothetical protein
MKKFIHSLLILTTILFINSCSSVKVLNSWKGDNAYAVKNNTILVIARTDNMSARIAFENEIVKDLTSKDIKATASFEKFPKLDPDKKLTKEAQEKIKTMLMDNGFDAVILTVVKEEQELTKTVTDGGYYAGSNYYGYYPRYYQGFNGYYGHVNSYSTLGNYVEKTSQTYTATNYILETVIYNLNESEEKQLVAVVTSKLEEPDNAATTAKQYVKAITKSFNKK